MEISLKDLSLEEKIGQMLMVGMDTTYITDRIRDLIQKNKIGGIILYRKNFNTYEDVIKIVKELKEINKDNKLPLFISIDQEGGRVNRMPKEIQNLPSANKVANTKNIELVEEAAQITSELLNSTGFNMNFAPVLDIKRFDNNHALGDRCFGDNVEDVSKYGIATMKKLQENNIISVIKHFPGHGATKSDSHYIVPIINKSLSKLEEEDMKTFENAINNGADAILVGHLVVKNVTGITPASLSRKFISENLRKKYKYNKLVITDDLKMRAIRFIYGPKKAIEKAFIAGNDIIVFRFNQKEETQAIKHLEHIIKRNKKLIGRLNRSVLRIIKMKEKYISENNEFKTIDINEINKKIKEIREKIS